MIYFDANNLMKNIMNYLMINKIRISLKNRNHQYIWFEFLWRASSY
jgi:hypothetical protein